MTPSRTDRRAHLFVADRDSERGQATGFAIMSEAEVPEAPGSEGKPEPAAGTVAGSVPHVQAETAAVPQTPPIASATEDEDESEDESEILEESPCGRWQKRRDQVRAGQFKANLFCFWKVDLANVCCFYCRSTNAMSRG